MEFCQALNVKYPTSKTIIGLSRYLRYLCKVESDEAQSGKVGCWDVIGSAKYSPSSFEVLPRPNNNSDTTYSSKPPNHQIPRNIKSHSLSYAMAGRRIAYIGLPVAAVGGYYLYAAGGDSKVAQKKAERLFTGNHKNFMRVRANADG